MAKASVIRQYLMLFVIQCYSTFLAIL